MANITTASGDHRRRVHTDVYSPVEVVLQRIVYYVFGFIEALLAIRFIFSLFGANRDVPFVSFIYGITDVFMVPFNAIFSTQRLGGATFEWSVLVAIAIYALISWAMVALIRAVSPREEAETVDTEESVDRDEHVRHLD